MRLILGRLQRNIDEREGEVAVDGAVGARTRVNPGGRQATKTARKEAKRRAKVQSRQSKEALKAKDHRRRLHDEV